MKLHSIFAGKYTINKLYQSKLVSPMKLDVMYRAYSVCEYAFRLHICISTVAPLFDGLKVIYDIQTKGETKWHFEMNSSENQIICTE